MAHQFILELVVFDPEANPIDPRSLQQNPVGIELVVMLKKTSKSFYDVSATDSRKLVIKSPYKAAYEVDLQVITNDGRLSYVMADPDFNLPGLWTAQVHLSGGGVDLYSQVAQINVLENQA